ncbi:MAG: envelope stress response membrane protein PspC [Deltaproteobacteria bacterium]|nr:MAG: envelope stress response membrane protein PspC [Deltaproteobacteria bacterium]
MRYHHKNKGRRGFDRCRTQYGRIRNQVDVITSASGVYRSRQGILMGVCRGLAQHFNFSVFWMRMVVFLLFLFTGFWPVGVLYIVAGLILKMEPVIPLKNEEDQEFYQSYTNSRESAIQRIKRKFDNIDRRIQRMEHTVTSREFEL